MGYRKGSRKYRAWHRAWMRNWRSNEANRLHEQAMDKLRTCLRAGDISKEAYLREVRHPWKVKVVSQSEISFPQGWKIVENNS